MTANSCLVNVVTVICQAVDHIDSEYYKNEILDQFFKVNPGGPVVIILTSGSEVAM